ncbi:unnamed protein product [Protopolystoma xenopodis]|uniref:Transcription and mRNA export factor ENY2 n=1 Tax=Protopolystoma xenopodis TaxID=117903 RepID=A0A448XFU0_9PLAT|nr:unnamed protein product [Protopolystoma xenopodis]
MANDDKSKLRAYINKRLVETGQREKLKDLLRTRLSECGWREDLKMHCQGTSFSYPEVIKKAGLKEVTVHDLVTEITPLGRRMVPDSVKQELLEEIREFLAKETTF